MTATQADVDNAYGGVNGLGIWRHNGTEWVKLNSTVTFDNDAGTWKVCANSSLRRTRTGCMGSGPMGIRHGFRR